MPKKKFKIEDYRLVQVNWIDAMDSETGWHSLNKLKKAQPEPVVSVGWIISEDDKRIVVTGDFCSDGETGRAITIPKDWCQKVTRLETAND
tara:strand:- start:2035 stop:2307 length:273 start_codon:yes stop_codon:yes gene_type:complete